MQNKIASLLTGLTLAACAIAFDEISADAQSLGQQVILNSDQLTPATTQTFTPGGTNQIFIGTSDEDYLGLSLQSVVITNGTQTNLPGTITLGLASTVDGIAPNGTTVYFTLNSTNYYSPTNVGLPSCTNFVLDSHGMAGWFVMSLAETNAGVNSATNLVSLKLLNKAAKTEAIPSTTKN